MSPFRSPSILLLALAASCHTAQLGVQNGRPRQGPPTVDDVAIARAPFHDVQVDWKQRMDVPYVFLELRGDHRQAGRWIGLLAQHAQSQGLAVDGPPFALFFDDPARTPVDQLRSRIALPVATSNAAVAAPLGFDVLPASNVVYARVGGAYSEVGASHGGLYAYLGERGWALDGPVRETYLVNPAEVQGFEELVTEVQMPWRPLF